MLRIKKQNFTYNSKFSPAISQAVPLHKLIRPGLAYKPKL